MTPQRDPFEDWMDRYDIIIIIWTDFLIGIFSLYHNKFPLLPLFFILIGEVAFLLAKKYLWKKAA